MFYTNAPQHEPSLQRSHQNTVRVLDLMCALRDKAASGAGIQEPVAPSCDGFQLLIDLYEALQVEEGPILCDVEEAAFEVAFRKLGVTVGQLGDAAGVLKRSVHMAVLSAAERVKAAAWGGERYGQHRHPGASSDDVQKVVRLWSDVVKPGLVEGAPRFKGDKLREWLAKEYEIALTIAAPAPQAASGWVLMPDEVDHCDHLMKALDQFEMASQQRGHGHTQQFNDAYRELQRAVVDVADFAEDCQIPMPSLVELAGNPFPDFFHERIRDAFIEGAALRKEAMRRRRRAMLGPSPTPKPAAALAPAPERAMLPASPTAGEADDQSQTTAAPPPVEPPAADRLGDASTNGNGTLPATDAAPGEPPTGPGEMNANGKPAATGAEGAGKSDKRFMLRSLYQLTGISDPRTLARYVELAGLPPTKRGGRHRRFTGEQVKAILLAIIDNSGEQILVDKCSESLVTIN